MKKKSAGNKASTNLKRGGDSANHLLGNVTTIFNNQNYERVVNSSSAEDDDENPVTHYVSSGYDSNFGSFNPNLTKDGSSHKTKQNYHHPQFKQSIIRVQNGGLGG